MSNSKPALIPTVLPRGMCPVCGKPSYSATGTHPQCSVARADAISRAARKVAGTDVDKTLPKKAWSKLCPKCKHQVPARRFVCDCGHSFSDSTHNQKTAI